MYRSASTNRVWDDYLKEAKSSPSLTALEGGELPVFEQQSDGSKKERSRAKFAENAVHVIPLVLLLCGLVLWIFCNPDADITIKGDSVAARIEGLTLEGELDTDSAQTGVLAGIDLGAMDRVGRVQGHRGQYRRASFSRNKLF